METNSHFKGKSVLKHIKDARYKGKSAAGEGHGIDTPGHIASAADAAKDTAICTLLIWIIANALKLPHKQIYVLFSLFIFGFLLWKIGRSAILAWFRLEHINNLIEDEKYEIENNRKEERDELMQMYQTKGFAGSLLDKVVDVLMSDDNKLLGLMLEEEFGIALETYEHPLKQALGTAIGVFLSACALSIGIISSEDNGLFFAGFIVIFISSYIIATIEQLNILNSVVWNLAIGFLASFGTYFIAQFIVGNIL